MAQPLSKAHEALGSAIRQMRTEQSLSQEELAVRSQLHRNYVGGIERGERNPSFTNLMKVAAALGVRLSVIIQAAESPQLPP